MRMKAHCEHCDEKDRQLADLWALLKGHNEVLIPQLRAERDAWQMMCMAQRNGAPTATHGRDPVCGSVDIK